MNFHDVSLPRFIEIFAIGKPEFTTSCATTLSGREARRSDRESARQKYIIKNCRLSESQFNQFNNFFRARRGRNFAFRFRDYADYKVSNQLIATGKNIQEFSLFKLYEDAVAPYYRIITKPVVGSVKLYIDNNPAEANIDYNNGKVQLATQLAVNQSLTADFKFDVPVRFCEDSFEYNHFADGSIELSKVELIEVIE